MDLEFSAEQIALQGEFRRFFAEEYPQDILQKTRTAVPLGKDDHVRSQQALQSRGWLAGTWPKALGGQGWSELEQYIFETELERAGAPDVLPMAIKFIGPIICRFGTDEQKARWLPDILSSRAMWAQGYSEPESGSDLASLRMTAVRDGDDYLVQGTKIWTSYAHWANWIFCLVRTSREARKQDGISLICAEMSAPGVTCHPIITIDGKHVLNLIEFDAVRVPATNLIGEEGRGWHYSNALLAAERISLAHIAAKKREIGRWREAFESMRDRGGQLPLARAALEYRIAACQMDLAALEISVLRAITGGASAAAISCLKISFTEMVQRITEIGLEISGRSAQARPDRSRLDWAESFPPHVALGAPAAASYLTERAQTLFAGATEVQKNIIWRQMQA